LAYRYEDNQPLGDPNDDGWGGDVINDDGHIVFEVWSNGDNGGNYYVWHDLTSKWGIEADAVERFTTDAPMDSWVAELRGVNDETTF